MSGKQGEEMIRMKSATYQVLSLFFLFVNFRYTQQHSDETCILPYSNAISTADYVFFIAISHSYKIHLLFFGVKFHEF